jgi:protein TonB
MKHWIKLIAIGVVLAVVCAAAPADPVKVSGSEQAGRITKMVKPVYPPEAKEAGVQGVVKLRATISKEGKVTDLQAMSGHPTIKDGKPVAVITDIDVNFTLSK